MKVFGTTKKLVGKPNNGENLPDLEVVEIDLVQCTLLDDKYLQKSKVLYTFTPNKSSAYLSVKC